MKRFVVYRAAGGDLYGGQREMETEEALGEVYSHTGGEVRDRVQHWMLTAGRGQHYTPTHRLLIICTAGRRTPDDEEAGPTFPYLFVFNDTRATIRDICKEADVRYKIGPNIGGDLDCPKGMYVHADDLRKLKRFLKSTGQRAEADWCQEVINLADARSRSVSK